MPMQCKHCGTEIADKALVCYRCGTATADPAAPAPPRGGRGLVVPAVAALAIVIIGALYMAMAARGNTPPLLNWTMLGLAGVIVVWRFWIGTRRRQR